MSRPSPRGRLTHADSAAIMVNGGVIMLRRGLRGERRGYLGLLAIDLIRIEPALRVDKGQSRAALALVHRTIETGVPAGVTGRAGLFDLDPDRILIAI